MKVSLIVSTYNRPDALKLCLLSVFNQNKMVDEIIVGDDGSRPETKELIDSLRAMSPVELKHVWQEDNGFRLAQIRNKCLAVAFGDLIIQVDGDVILHPDFVGDHVNFAVRGFYCKGGRVNLGRELTGEMCAEGKLRPLKWNTEGIENKGENALHLPAVAKFLSLRYRKNKETALGCNMSFYRDDCLKINGFDEYFVGWGGEDIDFGSRLKLLGLRKCHLKFAGIVFHLWHEDKFMYNKDKNLSHGQRDYEGENPYCEHGMDKYVAYLDENRPEGDFIVFPENLK